MLISLQTARTILPPTLFNEPLTPSSKSDNFSGVHITTIHFDTLRTIQDCKCIAETLNRQCPAYEMKTPNRGNGDKRRMGQAR